MVDGACRVVGVDGQPIAGLYAIGLAAGFVPHGPLGASRAFAGKPMACGCGRTVSGS